MLNERKLINNGNSIAMTIPNFLVRQLGLHKGDTVAFELYDYHDGSKPYFKVWKVADVSKEGETPNNTKNDVQPPAFSAKKPIS